MTPDKHELYLSTATTLKWLLGAAWLLPLCGFVIEIFGGYWSGRKSKTAAWLAVACIATSFLLSFSALMTWRGATAEQRNQQYEALHAEHAGHGDAPQGDAADAHAHAAEDHAHSHAGHTHAAGESHIHKDLPAYNPLRTTYTGQFYQLARFGSMVLSIDYYIDGLTVLMFTMVTLIATCIHIFATGYMSDELTEHYEDHQVHLSGGRHFHRPGRFYRFFAFLSLFCFSMLGLVLAGNIFQVFVFWELVGVCSFFLIGFYVERKSASNAANKAFIMNRVGDFGFLIGLMVLGTYFGTFRFANTSPEEFGTPGLFQMVRDTHGHMVTEGEGREKVVMIQSGGNTPWQDLDGKPKIIPYWLLIVAGLGVFAGCVGKSAQFPLQTWLPDAMEGPTPVSALVHSATMVAAGVYLVGRFYPMFTPEVLLVIAYIGCITAFVGATIAIVVTDIKRVLAYSTISQLGYMMLGLGVGGWMAGLFHLVTHAFFKSLMFLCSGSVIHGCHHEQDMTKMGGLRHKLPITAYTMLIGVFAIAGYGIPGLPINFSGFYSKDAIIASALSYVSLNPQHFLLFYIPVITAGITAFYMFRMWFMTFTGETRDHHVAEHAHESPLPMVAPLVLLAFLAWFCAFGGEGHGLALQIMHSEPQHVADGLDHGGNLGISLPSHHQIHEKHGTAGYVALFAALLGSLISYLFYCRRIMDAGAIGRQFWVIRDFLVEKWRFDELYDVMFTKPVHVIGRWCQAFDKAVLDGLIHLFGRLTIRAANFDRAFDERIVDRMVNVCGEVTYAAGRSLKGLQTGRLRQYVMFIALGVVSLFVLVFAFLPRV